jgi:hypothetical protein
MTSTQRRRNIYIANCCICGKEVKPGEGWLYADTKARPRRLSGSLYARFPKKVKCDRCHGENLTNKWQAANLDNPQPPTPRPWSAPQVRTWALEVEAEPTTRGRYLPDAQRWEREPFVLVHVHVTVNGERMRLAGGDPIDNHQAGPHYTLEWVTIGGRRFSQAAWQTLEARVNEAIEAARRDAGPVDPSERGEG